MRACTTSTCSCVWAERTVNSSAWLACLHSALYAHSLCWRPRRRPARGRSSRPCAGVLWLSRRRRRRGGAHCLVLRAPAARACRCTTRRPAAWRRGGRRSSVRGSCGRRARCACKQQAFGLANVPAADSSGRSSGLAREQLASMAHTTHTSSGNTETCAPRRCCTAGGEVKLPPHPHVQGKGDIAAELEQTAPALGAHVATAASADRPHHQRAYAAQHRGEHSVGIAMEKLKRQALGASAGTHISQPLQRGRACAEADEPETRSPRASAT